MAEKENVFELLHLTTPLIELTLKGDPSHPAFAGIRIKDQVATLCIACNDLVELCVYGDDEPHNQKEITAVYKHNPLFFEQRSYELVLEVEEGHTISFNHENQSVRKAISPVGRNHNLLTGIINFDNSIGYSDLSIIVDGKDYLTVTIEVFPSKIDYKDDYKRIIDDVTDEVYGLIFDFLKKTYSSFSTNADRRNSQVEFFAIIRNIFRQFVTAADIILRKPHHQLQTEHEILPAHKIKKFDNRTLRWIEKHPNYVLPFNDGFKAEKTLAVKKYVTFDTKENRLTKYILESTAKRLDWFKRTYLNLNREKDQVVISQIDDMVKDIQRRCNSGFMKSVEPMVSSSGMSLVFEMAPGYRELYRCYLLLQRSLSISTGLFNLSEKDLAVLYEYWCFLKLNSLLRDKYELLSQDVVKTNGNGISVTLKTGKQSTIKYRNPANGERITLAYNRSYERSNDNNQHGLPTVTQRPDNVLQLEKLGSDRVPGYSYVFDAKYRINPALSDTPYGKQYKTPGPEVDDINTMHRYRDAITYQKGENPYRRMMFGAYILFPYRNEEEFKNHPFYKSIDTINIGGLPFLPSSTSLVENLLEALVADSSDEAFLRATLPVGIEEKLFEVDWSTRDVLVSAIHDRAQLDYFRSHNEVYIPERQIRRGSKLRYIAMYQARDAFGSDAKIEYYGEITDKKTVSGSVVVGFPANPDEQYYCFTIDNWKSLSRPIRPKEHGSSVLYTNLFLLEHSTYIPELSFKSEVEYRLFTELNRITNAAVINSGDSALGFLLDDKKVMLDNEQIAIVCDGRIIGTCSIKDFIKTPYAAFNELVELV